MFFLNRKARFIQNIVAVWLVKKLPDGINGTIVVKIKNNPPNLM